MQRYSFRTLLLLPLFATLAACTGETGDDKDPGDTDDTGPEPTAEICDNGADDDDDGDTDCDDADCDTDPACALVEAESNCTDGLDDDSDGATDCDDTDCADDAACAGPTTETLCADGLDDDADGAIDCADTDCAADPACAVAPESNCDDGVDDDADGLIDCADGDCAADPACEEVPVEAACDDGVDDDLDGLTDCDDSDCAADAACAPPPSEAACDDGVDDDGDGLTDCDDSDCARDAVCDTPAVCGDSDLGSALGDGLATGTTTGGGDDYGASCSSSYAEDVSFLWTAPADGTYRVDTIGSTYDSVITLWSTDCSTEVSCDDDGAGYPYSQIEFTAVAGEVVVFVVDGYDVGTGDYTLNVNYAAELDCRDGNDEDGDGGADCADTDCATDATCIPEPLCEDGADDDLDGLVDCDDSDCAGDLACTHPCVDRDLGSAMGEAASATTAGEADDEASTCDTSGATAGDVSLLWTAPADATYTFSTAGSAFNTVLALQPGDCSGTELACNDDGTTDTTSEITMTLTAGEELAIVIDGAAGETGDFLLDIWADAEVVCDDGGDDDGDALVDCLDDQCTGSAACDVSLADVDLGSATGSPVATGDTTGGLDDATPTCTSSSAEDVSYAWVAPTAGLWTFDLGGATYDSALYLVSPGGEELTCNDDYVGTTSLVTASLSAGQLVIVVVDGYSSNAGTYTLGIY